jgi:hypothetical protein
MIAYDELCQVLDHFNKRRRNEAELAQLERTDVPARAAKPNVDENPAGGFASEEPEDTHEIDVDEDVVVEK